MDEILQRLTEVSIRQQQIVEHLATRQGDGAGVLCSSYHRRSMRSAVGLVQSHILAPRMKCKTFLPITCIHGDTRPAVPARRVTISAAPGTSPVEVGVMKDLPVPVLIGKDWPGFDRLLAMATQPASPRGDRQRRRPTKGLRQHPVLLASDSGRNGESPSQNPNLFYDVFQQVTGEG